MIDPQWNPWGAYRPLTGGLGVFQVSGVKRQGTEHGTEYFESCQHDDPAALGWTLSYDGIIFLPFTFKTPDEVKEMIKVMVEMFHAGIRHNQFQVKKVLGIE